MNGRKEFQSKGSSTRPTGNFTYDVDAETGEISNVSGTVSAILYEFTNFLETPEDGTNGGFRINYISLPVSSFNRGDSSVTQEIFSGADIVEGSDSLDDLMGFDGSDSLRGNGGSNWLNGGLGADFMAGGQHSDVYIVDNARDAVIEFVSEGADRVLASVTHRLQANVENLTLQGAAAINGVGNELNNAITGNSLKNYLYGNSGNDTLSGELGNDVLTGELVAMRST